MIATDTPERNKIAAAKQNRKSCQARKNLFHEELNVHFSEGEETENEEQEIEGREESTDETMEEIAEKERATNGHSTEVQFESCKLSDLSINDFVLVSFKMHRKNIVHYVGQILELKKKCADFKISFLQKSVKTPSCFVFPIVEDCSIVSASDIKVKLPVPKSVGVTKRQNSFYKFDFDFENLILC